MLPLLYQGAISRMLMVGAVKFQEKVAPQARPTVVEFVVQRTLQIEILPLILENALNAIVPVLLAQEPQLISAFLALRFFR